MSLLLCDVILLPERFALVGINVKYSYLSKTLNCSFSSIFLICPSLFQDGSFAKIKKLLTGLKPVAQLVV